MFSNTRLCRMTLADLPADPEGSDPGGLFVIYSAADFLYITEYTTPDRVWPPHAAPPSLHISGL